MFGREKYLFLYLLSHFVFASYVLTSIGSFFPLLSQLNQSTFLIIITLLTDLSIIYIFDNIKITLNEKIELYSFDYIIDFLLLTKGVEVVLNFYKILYVLENQEKYSILLSLTLSLVYLFLSIKLIELISFKGIFELGRLLFFSSILSATILLSSLANMLKGFAFHYIGNFFIDIYKVDNEKYWT